MTPLSSTPTALHAAAQAQASDARSDEDIAPLIAAVGGKPVAMVALARTLLLPSGRIAQARALCEEALAVAPHDPALRAMAGPILCHGIGGWYFTMVQDHGRHALYEQAFRSVITPGCTVLDIGAGTGLFAMMAARAGAARVIACERDEAVAALARGVVAANGLSDKVTILCMDSRDLRIGEHLPYPADVLVWDNLANNLFGVGCAATVEDAKARLVRPGAPVLPARVEVIVAPARDLRPQDSRMEQAAGFDLRAFNAGAPASFTIPRDRLGLLAQGRTLFDVDFAAQRHIASEGAAVEVEVNAGPINGVAQWLRFHLADGIVYDTADASVTAFGTQFHPVVPFEVTAPRRVTVRGGHDCANTWFWVES